MILGCITKKSVWLYLIVQIYYHFLTLFNILGLNSISWIFGVENDKKTAATISKHKVKDFAIGDKI